MDSCGWIDMLSVCHNSYVCKQQPYHQQHKPPIPLFPTHLPQTHLPKPRTPLQPTQTPRPMQALPASPPNLLPLVFPDAVFPNQPPLISFTNNQTSRAIPDSSRSQAICKPEVGQKPARPRWECGRGHVMCRIYPRRDASEEEEEERGDFLVSILK